MSVRSLVRAAAAIALARDHSPLPRLCLLLLAGLAVGCASAEVHPSAACGAGEAIRALTGQAIPTGPFPSPPSITSGSSIPPKSPGVALAPPPDSGPSDLTAEIIVIRTENFVGAASRWIITLDGRELYGMCPGEYVSISMRAGEHTLGLRWWGGWWPGWHEKVRTIAPHELERQYFLVGPSLGGADLKPTDAETGERQRTGSRGLW